MNEDFPQRADHDSPADLGGVADFIEVRFPVPWAVWESTTDVYSAANFAQG